MVYTIDIRGRPEDVYLMALQRFGLHVFDNAEAGRVFHFWAYGIIYDEKKHLGCLYIDQAGILSRRMFDYPMAKVG